MSVGWIVWSRICRIYWDFQDRGGPADAGGLGRALDESLRAFTRDHERLRVFTWVGRIVWSRICWIIWDFQDRGGPADAGGLVRALDESLRALREIMSVCVCLRVLGGLGGAGFAGFIGIFRMAGGPPALVRSYERWTRVCERLREIMSVCECLVAFARDWYGWPLWVDHEMGRISCIQTGAGCFEQSTK